MTEVGRNERFDEDIYLLANPDVAAAVLAGVFKDGFSHYCQFGRKEDRVCEIPQNFDEEFYLATNPDVAASIERGEISSALKHWLLFGRKEGRAYAPPKINDDFAGGIFSPHVFRYPYSGHDRIPEISFASSHADENDIEIMKRLVRSYKLAMEKCPNNDFVDGSGMWSVLTSRHPEFYSAIKNSDYSSLSNIFANVFQSHLAHGLAMGRATAYMARHAPLQFGMQFADRVLRMAESLAIRNVRAPEQWRATPPALDVDVHETVEKIFSAVGLPLEYPQVGGLFGVKCGNAIFPDYSLIHLRAALFVSENISGLKNKKGFEIGGGYGGLAYFLDKIGVPEFTIFDLPFSNLIQGYFLIKAQTRLNVVLYGEDGGPGSLYVLPWWEIESANDKSFEYAINQDSIPEMPRNIAEYYLGQINRITHGHFLSINQEEAADNVDAGQQNIVYDLIKSTSMARLRRNLYWLRDGYVEEVYSSGV